MKANLAICFFFFYFSCSTQLSMKFILLTNVKIVGILTFMRKINDWLSCYNPENSINFGCFDMCEQLKYHAQLS